MENERPEIGLGIIVKYEGDYVLLGKRKNSHGNGTWGFPGGHLENFESFEKSIGRELKEETGLILGKNILLLNKNPVAVTNDFFKKENKHYINLYMLAKHVSGNPKLLEFNKCERWAIMNWYEMCKREDLFLPIQNLIKQNYNPFK